MAGQRLPLVMGLLATMGYGCGDGEPPLRGFREPFRVVSGVPTVQKAPPLVTGEGAGSDPAGLAVSRSTHCDRFLQQTVEKVDILWVVRPSRSMEPWLDAISDSMEAFVGTLAAATPPVDFHLGLITSDLDAADPEAGVRPGWLRSSSRGAPAFISCGPVGARLRCNVGDGTLGEAVAAFRQSLGSIMGWGASTGEKGLLAASLALTEPAASGRNAGFRRSDANLRVIFAADEDDASCGLAVSPLEEPATCTSSTICACDEAPGFGSTSYFARLLLGLEGYGGAASIGADAVVASAVEILNRDDGTDRSYLGCTTDSSRACAMEGEGGAHCGIAAPRYREVAAATGGRVLDLCADDLAASVATLGFGASGIKREFLLTRAPISGTIETVVVPNDPVSCDHAVPCADPALQCVRDRCVEVVSRSSEDGWWHERCAGEGAENVIRFNGGSVPGKMQTVEVCYDVDVGFDLSQCR